MNIQDFVLVVTDYTGLIQQACERQLVTENKIFIFLSAAGLQVRPAMWCIFLTTHKTYNISKTEGRNSRQYFNSLQKIYTFSRIQNKSVT